MREGSNWPVFQKYWTSKYRAYPLGVGSAPRAFQAQKCATCLGQIMQHCLSLDEPLRPERCRCMA